MAAERVSVAGLTPERVERFARWRRDAGYRHSLTPAGLAALMAYLHATGALPVPVTPPRVASAVDLLMERYRRYLQSERGLAPLTLRYYLRIARLFACEIADSDGELVLSRLDGGAVSCFVLAQCSQRSVGSAKNVVASLRSLLRFLHVEGLTVTDLTGAVPAVAPSARSLPRALEAGMAARLLSSCDRRTAVGRRDHAVLMVLSRLGLRAGEVAAIEFSDVDWRAGELLVRGKGSRLDTLPLPVDVGEALAGYVQRGRPGGSGCERLFLRVKAPVGGLSGSGVSGIVHGACRRCSLPKVGAHRLRHSAATETLRAGGSLQEIGQLLRQRSTFTTAIYARVDREALRQLARPWPEGGAA